VSWLTNSSSKQRCCCFKRRRESFLLFPSPLVFRFSFFLFFHCQVVSPFVLPVYFSLKFPPLFQASLYSFLPLSISFSLFSILFILSFFRFHVLVLRAVFIRQGGARAFLSPPITVHEEWRLPTLSRRRARWPMGVDCRA